MIKQQGLAVLALVFAGTLLAAPASAGAIFPAQALTDDELAALRGGFLLDDLEIRIGLEQVVSVDGETLAINRLNIPNLNQMSNGRTVPHTVETIVGKAGGQALISSASKDGGWITVIQNNLNGTAIQNSRQLNIELNNLGSGLNRLPDDMREPVLQMLGR